MKYCIPCILPTFYPSIFFLLEVTLPEDPGLQGHLAHTFVFMMCWGCHTFYNSLHVILGYLYSLV